MYGKMKDQLRQEINSNKEAGLYKEERVIVTDIGIDTGDEVINMCANNYLGLSNHPELRKVAKETIDTRGFGMSSVRFICGTQDVHKKLEQMISYFF